MMFALLLVILSILQSCYGQTIINVASGVYSTKAESDGLHLSSTSTFTPIDTLTISLHFTSPVSIFLNYQITVGSSVDFWTILQVNRDDDGLINAGSLVHCGTQLSSKTLTGYWMDNLEPGSYTFEVHYKSSSSISISSGTDYQAAILQAMWFTSVRAVSHGVKCYPSAYYLDRYNVLNPIKDLKVELFVPSNRVVIAGYQMSIYSSSDQWFTARLYMNNQQQPSTIMTQGDAYYFSINSLWMDYLYDAEYEFGITYQNAYSSYFEDCRNNYQGNKNLYAMYLPSTCRELVNLRPTSSLSLSSTSWKTTDLSYTFTLYRDEHIFVRYQYSTTGRYTYTITRLVIDSVPAKHTASITGNTVYAGNSGMWQGVLSSGTHTIAVEHRSGSTYTHYVGDSYPLYTRAMDIIRCY